MQILKANAGTFERDFQALQERPAIQPEIVENVRTILKDVRLRGNAAVSEYAAKFDNVTLQPDAFCVSEETSQQASAQLSSETINAITRAHRQIVAFSEKQLPQAWSHTPREGVVLGEQFAPLDRVGVYVPGGTAPLVSTVLHTVTLAKTAGVKEIVVVTPPGKEGVVHPAILEAARVAGTTEIYRLGGVYAVGALAYGTATIKPVEKIVGPGNAWVTAAKKEVYGAVALDMVAGPSEILVIADHTANPAHIAADLLSQIEHGSGHEQAVLVTDCADLMDTVKEQIVKQTEQRNRAEAIRKCLDNGVITILVDTIEDAPAISNRYAPEHLEIITENANELADKITAAGAIFVGPWTPEPVGDFVAGPSHVLPTGGSARYFSGLTVHTFFRRMSRVQYTKDALAAELDMICCIADNEGLDAHRNSAAIRLQD